MFELSSTLVAPAFQPSLRPPIRPDISSPAVKSAKKNLFGSCSDDGTIDKMLAEEHKKQRQHLINRYNLDIEQLDVNAIAATFYSAAIKNLGELETDAKAKRKLITKTPYTRTPSIKETYVVRKSTTNGNSNVPKRKSKMNSSSNNNNNTQVDSHNSELGGRGENVENVQQQKELKGELNGELKDKQEEQ